MKRLNRSLIVAAPALIALMLSSSASSGRAQSAAGTAAQEKASWSRVGCYACHGYAGQGSDTTGPQLSGRKWTLPIFSLLVRHPLNSMPPYSVKVLSNQEILDLMTYVNSVPVKNR